MSHAAGTAVAYDDSPPPIKNGNSGVLTTLGKSSWLLGMLLTLTTAGVGGYFAVKQDMTVGLATLQIQVTQNESSIKEMRETLKQMVPAEVHKARQDMQEEVDKWHDAYLQERMARIEEQIRLIRERPK